MAKEKDLNFDEMEYVTNRKVYARGDDEREGRLKMYSYDGENFTYALQCPYCGEKTSGEIVLEKRPYYIPCEECGKKTSCPRLKNKVKKDPKK